MSCGNIGKETRSKLSSKCWVKIAQIPIGNFLETEHDGVLNKRLYHLCMDIVTKALKECSVDPILMSDADGNMCLVRTILLSHIADLPEQQMIACVGTKSSPITMARFHDLGLPVRRELRTGASTIDRISKIKDAVDTSDITRYVTKARTMGMNAVYKPYWRDWEYADPCRFLTPDALHQWHKFFWDHPMKWARALLGDAEIDRRYKTLQKHVGRLFFRKGFTSFSQHTCRESRELQASFISVISGAVTPGVLRAFRGIMDFIYIGQFEVQSTETLRLLQDALNRFHADKHHLSDEAACDDGWHIPKLEMMHNVASLITQTGSAPQYTAERLERCHITMSKMAYRATNHKDYEEQMCRYLDRQEKLYLFDMYLRWRSLKEGDGKDTSSNSDSNTVLPAQEDEPYNEDELFQEDALSPFAKLFLPKTIKNAFAEDEEHTPRNETTAFSLTSRITRGNAKTASISVIYGLPKLSALLSVYQTRYGITNTTVNPRSQLIDCWDRVRLQLRSVETHGCVMKPTTVMACPPSDELPFGLYNFVLVKTEEGSDMDSFRGKHARIQSVCSVNLRATAALLGHFVAQLRLVFQPLYPTESNPTQKPQYLAYIEPLKLVHRTVNNVRSDTGVFVDKDSRLARVERVLDADGSRTGVIIQLTDIWRPIDLVPNFGETCPLEWNTDNACEVAQEYSVNTFHDKQTYVCLR